MKNLAAALVAAQKAMPKVEPDGKANYGMYVTLDHLIAKTRPVLNANGLAITQFPSVTDLGAPVLRTILSHESGEQLSADCPLFLQKQDMQAFGAAITYARRYGWASVLGIAEQEDDDGAKASAPPAAQKSAGGQKQEAPSPVVGAGDGDPVTGGLHKRILELADELGANRVTVQRSINDNRAKNPIVKAHQEWCERQIKTMEANVAAKKAEAGSPFQPPDSVKEKAA